MSIQVTVTRDVAAQKLHFDATFPASSEPWTLQLPTWRPGRYELANFAQYVMWVKGVAADGTETRLSKADLHSWHVPAGVNRVSWLFHADILNAGSTCVESDLFYVNPVNCFMYDVSRPELPFEIRLADLTLAEGEASGWALATALPWTLDEGVPVMRARDVQHVMDAPWVASPKLWHDSYREQGVDFHVWVHDTLPADPARFMSEHVAFTRAQLSYFWVLPHRGVPFSLPVS